jgi:methionyl-tRNA formyltransferase
MTKVVFMGTPQFSVPILQSLIDNDYEVLAVVTQPDRAVGRKRILTPTPVKECAVQNNIKVLQPEKISGSPEMEEILAMDADIIITAAFGQFLPEKLLHSTKFGALNVHASLLPKYRGGAPVHYSIINGDEKTGVTIMEMVKKMDAGDIVSQAEIPINKKDVVGMMFDKLSILGRDLLIETLPKYLAGEITPLPQNEEEVTFSPNITREEEKISWEKTAEQIDCQVRGMHPWPVAYAELDEKRLKIYHAEVSDQQTTEAPGTVILRTKKELTVACGNGTALSLKEVQLAGKQKMKITDFLNGVGSHVEVGHVLS